MLASYLIINDIEREDTNSVNILLRPAWTPSPVVARSCGQRWLYKCWQAQNTDQFWEMCCTWGSWPRAFAAPLREAGSTATPDHKKSSVNIYTKVQIPHIEAVGYESVVEKLTKNKSSEVNIVSEKHTLFWRNSSYQTLLIMNVFWEISDQLFFLLMRILYKPENGD